MVYTHGNGFVAAPANQVNAELEDTGGQGGLPRFTVSDIDDAAATSRWPSRGSTTAS